MRIVFSLLGLVIVLAIIGSLAKTQLQALRSLPQLPAATATATAPQGSAAPAGERGGRLDAFPGAAPADTSGLTVPQQSRNLQQQVSAQVQQQLQQGAARAAAEP